MQQLSQKPTLVYYNSSFAYADNTPSPKQDSVGLLNASGIEHAENGAYNLAVNKFSTAVELDPEYTGSYCNRGIAYFYIGEYEKSIKDFTRAIELNPQNADFYNNRGVAYGINSEYEKSIKDFTKAIELNPQNAKTYCIRGVVHHNKGEINQAIEGYNAAIKLSPNCADAYHNRGNAYRDKGEMDKAIADYSQAIVLKPKVVESYYTRGEAWLHIGKWEEAQRDLTAAILQGVDIADKFHNTYGSIEVFEKEIGVKLPENIVELLTPRQEPFEIDKDTRVALAMKYYEKEELSSGLAARLAGVSREEFMYLMGNYGLSPFGTAEDLRTELENARKSSH